MKTKKIQFKDVEMDENFILNGNAYKKLTGSSAFLYQYNRVFKVGKNEIVEVAIEG
jgi:hypothetical protein